MFVNAYDITLTNADGNEIPVALRLGVGAQLRLKKKFNESTTTTLFSAADDVDRFVAIMDEALKWTGNQNEIKSGEQLIDLMTANDLLGMVAKQNLLTAIGRASGLFSEDEKKRIDSRSAKILDDMFGEVTEEEAAPVKNALAVR